MTKISEYVKVAEAARLIGVSQTTEVGGRGRDSESHVAGK